LYRKEPTALKLKREMLIAETIRKVRMALAKGESQPIGTVSKGA